jgi:hypothetical protein
MLRRPLNCSEIITGLSDGPQAPERRISRRETVPKQWFLFAVRA